jgi:Uma2 family endonuclease
MTTFADPSSPRIDPRIELPKPLVRYAFTTDQYHRMIDLGILPSGSPYELIDGQLVRKDRSKKGDDPTTVGTEYAWTVKTIAKLDAKLKRLGSHMQTQQPLQLSSDGEPEPDGAIIRGTEDDYRDRLPTNADATCVIEVADSSLQWDRTTKQRLYAAADIPQYVIINLVDRCVEVHTDPQPERGIYGKRIVLQGKGRLELNTAKAKTLNVAVRSLLP